MNYFKKWNLLVGWIVFAIAATVYILTMEPTTSLWDCAEFIATSYKLEVGHPPGAPLFMMIARLFTAIGGSPANAAMMVNLMSSLASAFTILFLFWSITHLARKIYAPTIEQLSKSQMWSAIGAGAVGALAYTFSDTFWFSAIEGEVYAMSSLFTAIAFWAILQWENIADKPHSTRWLVLIAYLMGLSIGVHILNLLTIPALVFVYYFKKEPNVTKFGIFKALVVSGAILLAINAIIIPYTIAIGAWLDRIFVNSFDLPVNSGLTLFVLIVFALAAWGIYYTHTKGRVIANTIILCTTVILIGYSSYASVVIRASANPPMNSNNPSDPYALLSLLNRDQYGQTPLLTGPYYSAPAISYNYKESYMLGEDGKYHETSEVNYTEYPSQFTTFFPRLWSDDARHIRGYKSWVDIKGKQVQFRDEIITVPTFGENLQFFFRYQMNFMYWRYFLWNFVGRQNDTQGHGDVTNGNWISGIDLIDELYLGPQDNLPSEMGESKSRNTYYFLPFILGLLGLLYQLKRDKKNFAIVMMMFLMMGVVLVLYFNNKPYEPRERDYIFAGSFYAFCIWIGLGVIWLKDNLTKYLKKDSVVISVVAIAIASSIPIILAVQNWDDHDRSGRYFTRDLGANYLNSTLPNSIIINMGDNDTFPLWYSQEVEGTRLDVKIMNESYLSRDWYVDQMRIKSNESMPVPFSISKSKCYQYSQMFVHDKFDGKAVDIASAIYMINSDDPRAKRSFYGGEPENFLAAKNLAIPVNKKNAIASGIVSEEDAHLMVDTVYMSVNSNVIGKNELMLIDLFANFDWKRPIYFTQLSTLQKFGLLDYLQFDGLAYRFVPIKTQTENRRERGRIDTEYLYSKLMNEFKYGNISDPDVYVDYFVDLNMNASDIRFAFPRLAKELLIEGDTTRAIEVLDRGLEVMPISRLKHDANTTISMIQVYYAANAFDKGNVLMDDYTRVLEEYIDYYVTFPNSKADLISNDFNYNLQLLSNLYSIAEESGQKEQASRIYNLFEKHQL